MATKSFQDMADSVFESNWLELPVDLKKFLIVMIATAQRPISYHGFELVYLNLDTFTHVREILEGNSIVFSYRFHFLVN